MATATAREETGTGRKISRAEAEATSVEAWLEKIARERPEVKDEKDFDYLADLMPRSISHQCVVRFLPLIWNRALHPGRRAKVRSETKASTEERARTYFVDAMWAHYSPMTGAQARAEAGQLVSMFAEVKPRQLVGKAMTREQFGERFAAA